MAGGGLASPAAGTLDDSYRSIIIRDFAGGWVTLAGSLGLASNQSPDLLNVLPLPGRLRFRGGYTNIIALPYAADAAWPFYDSTGGKHYAVWAGGNLYDLASGAVVTVATGVYTAGSVVGHVDLNGILYWSVGGTVNPVALQYWNPASSTHGAVTSAGGTGVINPPASSYLFVYTGSIVALAPYWGAPATGNVLQSNVFCWCVINDPTTWFATSAQAVGSNNGGTVIYGGQFGLAAQGVAPEREIVIMRNDNAGIYAYTGALGSLGESLLNCPVGCRDPGTVQYLPTAGMFGSLIFLGTDGQIWLVNGIASIPVSGNITDTLVKAVAFALASTPGLRFSSGYNEEWQYYWCDVAGVQYAYLWQSQAWTQFTGWPAGPTFLTTGYNGAPAYYVAGNSTAPFFSQIAQDNTADNGVMPLTYWKSPYLHGGDWLMAKEFHWAALATYNSGAKYSIQCTGNLRIDGSFMQSQPAIVQSPSGSGSTAGQFVLGQSILGGPDVLAQVAPGNAGVPVIMSTPIACPVPESVWIPPGSMETLKANALQVNIQFVSGSPAFDVLGVEVQYVNQGYLYGAGNPGNPSAGAPTGFDPFISPDPPAS